MPFNILPLAYIDKLKKKKIKKNGVKTYETNSCHTWDLL